MIKEIKVIFTYVGGRGVEGVDPFLHLTWSMSERWRIETYKK